MPRPRKYASNADRQRAYRNAKSRIVTQQTVTIPVTIPKAVADTPVRSSNADYLTELKAVCGTKTISSEPAAPRAVRRSLPRADFDGLEDVQVRFVSA